ncbi:MAG: hypothetical protein DPW09_01455 [Anaerolineae bacterium]|nr:hypothetical protein [Anaerolineae bacterium]
MAQDPGLSVIQEVDGQPESGSKKQKPGASQTGTKRNGSNNSSGSSGGRQQRLIVHLLVAFFMVGIAIGGYAFFRPGASAAADKASNHLVHVPTDIPAAVPDSGTTNVWPVPSPLRSDIAQNTSMNELAALQAEMDEITRKLNALKAENGPLTETRDTQGSPFYYDSTSEADMAEVLSKLDQMMGLLQEMAAKGDSGGSQTGGMGGHGHH